MPGSGGSEGHQGHGVTTRPDADYYDAYFEGTQSILAENNWHKSGQRYELIIPRKSFYHHEAPRVINQFDFYFWKMMIKK